MVRILKLLDRAIQPVWNLFTSVRFAVIFIATLGVLSVYGTFLPTEESLAYFGSWWFNALLCVLLVNLVICTANKWPWSVTQIGYLTVHAGLITIIVGAVITNRYGVEGQLSLREGTSQDHFWMTRDSVLEFAFLEPDQVPFARQNARSPDDLWRFVHHEVGFKGRVRLSPEGHPIDEDLDYRWDLDGGIELEVLRYLPNLVAERGLAPEPSGEPDPTVEVTARFRDQEQTMQLRAEHPERHGVFVPDPATGESVPVVHLVRPTEEELDPLVAEGRLVHPEGILRVRVPDEGIERSIDVAGALGGEPIELEDGTTLRLTGQFRDPRLTERDGQRVPVEGGVLARNPIVEVVVTPPDGPEDVRVVSARHPDRSGTFEGTEAAGVELAYEVGPAAHLPARGVCFLGTPSDPLVEVVVRDGTTSRTLDAGVGDDIGLPGADGVTISIGAEGHGARRVRSEGDEPKNPSFLVRMSRDGEEATAWVPLFESVVVDLGGQSVLLRYDRVRVPLGFRLQLEDFVLRNHEGTNRPASFESSVLVRDRDTGTERVRIEMNDPLVHRGYTFFQSSYDPDTLKISTFSVSRDPGYKVVYAGFGILVVGVICIFYLKPWLRRRLKERLAREHRARAEASDDDPPEVT